MSASKTPLTPPRSSTPPPLKKKERGGVAALPFSLGFLNPAGGVRRGSAGLRVDAHELHPLRIL